MKSLKDFITESIFDDIDDSKRIEKTIKEEIKQFLKDNYTANRCKISKKPNEDGKYVVDCLYSMWMRPGAKKLVSDHFVFGKVGGDFTCSQSVVSLKGAPKEVGGDFKCIWCESLTSLEGAPEKVGGCFGCSSCKSLKSLKGAPKEVGSFSCHNCGKKFTEDDVKSVSKVERKIYV